ncbi:hypothetical protein GCM10023189_58060 [Nibrella saemangeumensis]|uniref:WD40-like Beta Propeller Repeat n=1 Tax=Nibrella saemangeumensis TaxID=1084526 RepID=A0ABP8NRZ0_9BACT
MKQILYKSLFLVALLEAGCEGLPLWGHRSEGNHLPESPLNLSDINSPDDDFNSEAPSYGEIIPLVFSSKRGGKSHFDFVKESMDYGYIRKSGTFYTAFNLYGGLSAMEEQRPIDWAVSAANSPANELGPYIRSYDQDLIPNNKRGHYGEYLMLFASDRSGQLDIYLTHNYQATPVPPTTSGSILGNKVFNVPVPIAALNSSADDAYPTFNKDYNEIYFTSNRNGTFDIFRAILPDFSATELHTKLPALSTLAIEKVTALSGAADDKCPYINGNTLVFTSNRPGGLGGYDLYYATYQDGNWSEPVNFGPRINSAHDEYRPVLREPALYAQERLLIFSSNRPGGKGGFDLYLVGVPK